jgi:ribosomal protein L24
MHIPWHKRGWKSGDRVIVAIGKHKGKIGTITMYASNREWLVLLDGEDTPRKFVTGALDPYDK